MSCQSPSVGQPRLRLQAVELYYGQQGSLQVGSPRMMGLLSYNETSVAVGGITGWEPLNALVVLCVVGSSTMSMSPYVRNQTRSLSSCFRPIPSPLACWCYPFPLFTLLSARWPGFVPHTHTAPSRSSTRIRGRALRCGRVALLALRDDCWTWTGFAGMKRG
jgi:hypothetical protein